MAEHHENDASQGEDEMFLDEIENKVDTEQEEEHLGSGHHLDQFPRFDALTELLINLIPSSKKSPRLAAAWRYFANVTLPRYIHKEDSNNPNDFRVLEPGEQGGYRYKLWGTPWSQLGDFGLGMGLYFGTLVVMGTVFFVGGLINVWTIVYFSSDKYSSGQPGISGLIRGSGICNERGIVCLSADCSEWSSDHRTCEISLAQGILDFVTTLFFFVVVLLMGKVQHEQVELIDEGEQTAEDYSVLVADPTPDATDPDEWKEFFESRFGHVSYVTVMVTCGELMESLQRRRDILKQIRTESLNKDQEERACNPTVVITREELQGDNNEGALRVVKPLPEWKIKLMPYGLYRDLVYWHEKLMEVQEEIDRLKEAPKKATQVYVTFEMERDQRACLKAMTTGMIPAMLDRMGIVKSEYLFRHNNVLSVSEAPAPAGIYWENLEFKLSGFLKELVERLLLTGVIVGLGGVLVWVMSIWHASAAAIFISLNNVVIPMLLLWITNNPRGGEHHHTDSSYQSSLMLKIVATQWMNTGFIIYIIHTIYDAPEEDYISQVSKVLWADAFTSPILIMLDINGRIMRHFVARSAKTQDKTNSFFNGTKVLIAERYSSMLKTMFVCLFFSAIFPQGYFIASMALFMTFWASKFCLFNVWKTPPPVDQKLATITSRYLLLALLIHILVSVQFYRGWPFDRLCPTDEVVTSDFSDVDGLAQAIEKWEVDNHVFSTDVPVVGDIVYEVCKMDTKKVWGVEAKDWMPHAQEVVVHLFSVFGTVMTTLVGLFLFGNTLWNAFYRLWFGVYQQNTDVQEKEEGFSDVEQINAYIPELKTATGRHTLLATDLSRLETEHISWQGKYEKFNLCSEFDLPDMTQEDRAKLFGRCVYYPPPGYDLEKDEQQEDLKDIGAELE